MSEKKVEIDCKVQQVLRKVRPADFHGRASVGDQRVEGDNECKRGNEIEKTVSSTEELTSYLEEKGVRRGYTS